MAESGVIHRGVRIKGELSGASDLAIEGEVDGEIRLDHHLVIEKSGSVGSKVQADQLTVRGRASGRLDAKQKIVLEATAIVTGELHAPSIAVDEGAQFTGTIHMDVGIDHEV